MHTVQTEDPHQASTLGNPRWRTQGHLFENGTIPSFLGYASNGDSRWLYSPQTGLVIWPMEISNTHSKQAYEMGITDFIGGDIWYDKRKVDEITLDHNSNSAWIPEAQKELLAQGYNPTLVDNLAGTLHEFQGKNVSTWKVADEGWTPSVLDREEEHYDMIPFVWNNGVSHLGEPGELHSSLIYGNADLMALWGDGNSEFYSSTPDEKYVGRIFDDGEVLSWDEHNPHIPEYVQDQLRQTAEQMYPGYFEGKYTYDKTSTAENERWLYSYETGLVTWPESGPRHVQKAYELGIDDYVGGDILPLGDEERFATLDYDENGSLVSDAYEDLIGMYPEMEFSGGKWERFLRYSHESSESQRLGAAVKIEQLPGDDREGMNFIKFIYVPAKNTLYWWLVSEYNGDPYHATMEYDLDLSYPMKWIKGYIDPDEGLEFYPDYNPQTYQNEFPAISPELQKAIDSLPGLLPKTSAVSSMQYPGLGDGSYRKFVYDAGNQRLHWWSVAGRDGMPAHHWQQYENQVPDAWDDNMFPGHWDTENGITLLLPPSNLNPSPANWTDAEEKNKYYENQDKLRDQYTALIDENMRNSQFNPDLKWHSETFSAPGELPHALESHLKNSAGEDDYHWYRWIYSPVKDTTYIWPGGEYTHEEQAYSNGLGTTNWYGGIIDTDGDWDIYHYDEDTPIDQKALYQKVVNEIQEETGRKIAAGIGTRLRWLLDTDGQIHIGDSVSHSQMSYDLGVTIQWGGYVYHGGRVELVRLEHEDDITQSQINDLLMTVYNQAKTEGYQPDGSVEDMYVPYMNMPEDRWGHIENGQIVWSANEEVTPDEFDQWQQNFSKVASYTFDPADPPTVSWPDPSVVPHNVEGEILPYKPSDYYKFIYDPAAHHVSIWATDEYEWPHHTQMKYIYGPHTFGNFIGEMDASGHWLTGYGDGFDDDWKRAFTPFIQNVINNHKTAGPVNEDAFGPDEIHWEENFVYGNGEVAFGVTEHSELAYENGMYDDPVCGWIFESNHMPTKAYVVFQSIYYGGEAATPENKKEIMNILRNTGRYRNGITEIPYESWMGDAQMDGVNGIGGMWSKVAGDYPLEIHEVPEEAVPGYDMGRPTQRHPIIYDPRSNEVFIGPYNSHHQPVQYKYGLSGTTDGFYNPDELNNGRSYSNKGIHWFAEPPDEVKQALEQHFNEPYSKIMNWDKGQYEKF